MMIIFNLKHWGLGCYLIFEQRKMLENLTQDCFQRHHPFIRGSVWTLYVLSLEYI